MLIRARCRVEECQNQRVPETTQALLRGGSDQRRKGQMITSVATYKKKRVKTTRKPTISDLRLSMKV